MFSKSGNKRYDLFIAHFRMGFAQPLIYSIDAEAITTMWPKIIFGMAALIIVSTKFTIFDSYCRLRRHYLFLHNPSTDTHNIYV